MLNVSLASTRPPVRLYLSVRQYLTRKSQIAISCEIFGNGHLLDGKSQELLFLSFRHEEEVVRMSKMNKLEGHHDFFFKKKR